MKRFFALLVILAFSFLLCFGSPNKAQLSAEEKLSSKYGGNLEISWSEKRNTPEIINFSTPVVFSKNREESSKLLLDEINDLIGQNKDLYTFKLLKSRERKGIKSFWYQQLYKGVPIYGSEVAIAVNENGGVKSAISSFYNDISINTIPSISYEDAANISKNNPRSNLEYNDSLYSNKLIIYPMDDEYFLAYEVLRPSTNNQGAWYYYIDANNGSILYDISDLVFATGVYYPTNPRYSSINTGTLYNANNLFYIKGTFANILNAESSRAFNLSNYFVYDTLSTHFDESNLYYQINKIASYYAGNYGFDEFTQIDATTHGLFYDSYGNLLGPNAGFNRGDNTLKFSDDQGYTNYNSLAQDDKIIYHEYTHAVSYNLAGIYSARMYNEIGAISEGLSDYFPATYTGREVIGEWAVPSSIRRDITEPVYETYAEYSASNHEPHDGGWFFSACLWDLKNNIGSVYNTDDMVYDALANSTSTVVFSQFIQKILDADYNMFNSVYENIIKYTFYNRGITALGTGSTTTAGALSKDEIWYFAKTLTGNVTVPTGKTLTIKEGADIDLGAYSVESTGGTIIIEDESAFNPYVCLKSGTTVKGIYSGPLGAIADGSSGDIVDVGGDYLLVDFISVTTSGVTLNFNSSANIDLDIYLIMKGNGTITIESGATFTPDIRLMSGSSISGLYPTLASAYSVGTVVEIRGTHTFSDNYTVTSTRTLKPMENCTVSFPANKYLYVEGNLTASDATFTNSGNTSWGGIRYQSGSTGSLTDCNIEDALFGVYLNGSARPISNCDISNNTSATSYGIYCNGVDPNLENNKISTLYGIKCNDSNPILKDNEITSEVCGLYCENYSDPELSSVLNGDGDNYFHGSTIIGGAVYITGNSNPVIGFTSCGLEEYGNNSFAYSFVDDKLIYNYTSNTIMAQYCWWGGTPSSSMFYGSVDYSSPLTSLPTYSMPGLSPENNLYDTRMMLASTGADTDSSSVEEGLEDFTRYYDELWSLETKVGFLRYLISLGEANGVADLCKDIIFENPYQPEAFTALNMLNYISRNEKIKKDFDKDMLKTYLKTFEDSKGNEFIEANAMLLLAGLNKDVALMNKVYKKHKDTYMGKFALQQEFMYYFNEAEDTVAARAVLNEMDEVYPDEAATYESHVLMGDEVIDPKEFYSQLHEKEGTPEILQTPSDISEILPEEYSLSPAYPNPFNPSTTIEFALPVQSDVECSIFDLRGNLVKEYNYAQNAGTYSIVWNASNVSSGIYLIRFVAEASDGSETFVDYQKVTLLK